MTRGIETWRQIEVSSDTSQAQTFLGLRFTIPGSWSTMRDPFDLDTLSLWSLTGRTGGS